MRRSTLARSAWLLLVLGAASAQAQPLTIERIFAAPDLSGPALRTPQISPDGRRVTFLQGKADDKDRLDLWEYDLTTGRTRLLVDSRRLLASETPLSAEEQQRRERQRISSLSGIVEYLFAPDGQALLFPLGGDLYYYDLRAAALRDTRAESADQPAKRNPQLRRLEKPQPAVVRQLTATEASETDARFSPGGRYVSFIRDQDLFVIELATGVERAVTTDGDGPVQNGMAEFIAQEEMSRNTGYWWSPDERLIAYLRTDESGVELRERFEISAENVAVIRQRYPAAGTPNVKLALRIAELASGRVTDADLGANPDIYVARVNWFPDGRNLAVQRQSRDQRRLDLLRIDAASGAASLLLTETSPTWVDLHDELTFLERSRQFIWASSRTGYKHLYLYDLGGKLVRPLTAGAWMVVGDGDERAVLGVDEARGNLYFMANERSPLERHLYVTALDTSAPTRVRRITNEAGWHSVKLSPDARFFLETYSTPERPPRVRLRRRDGTVIASLVENALDASHPYAPFLDHHVPTEFGTVPADDGQVLHYQVLKPRNFDPSRKYALIVDVYGGPGFQRVRRAWSGGPRTNEGFFRQVLAQNGYVVLTLDNRGTGFRGVAFERALHRHMGTIEVADQVAAVRRLSREPWIDSGRVGVFGWSYGGYMALMCLFTAPEVFHAGVAGAPVTDWRLYDTHYTERYLGMPQTDAATYEASSVLSHAASLDGSLLVMHGMADDNVLFSHSTKLFKQLQDLRKPFDVMTYPGSKHGLLRHADTGPHAYATIKRFLDTNLRMGMGTDPVSGK